MRGKKKAAKAENHERWLITYADLITLLLVFFIVLYASSIQDQRKFAQIADSLRSAFNNTGDVGAGGNSPVFTGSGAANAGGGTPEQDLESITAILQKVANERGIADRIGLRMEQDRIVIGLTGDLLFASGSAQLRESAAPVLDAVATALRGKPNEIRVEGHTDSIPINTTDFGSNWELSAARATSVLRYLVEKGGLPASKLGALGFGETRPRDTNATAEGRNNNRRAEIVVLYPPAGTTPSPAPATPSGR